MSSDNLVVVTTGLKNGGAERVLFNLLNSISGEQRERIHVVSLGPRQYYTKQLEELDKATLTHLNLRSFLGLVRLLTLAIKLHKSMRNGNRIKLCGWMYHGSLIASLLSFLLGDTKVFWSFRQSLDNLGDEKLSLRVVISLLRLLSNRCETIIYNSEVALSQHTKLGFQANSIVIDNGYDLDAFGRTTHISSSSTNKEERHFLFVGRNHEQKDLSGLFRAFEIAWEGGLDGTLTVVSPDSTVKETLHQTVINKKLHERVKFAGEQREIGLYYPNFHFICLKSVNREAFPNVIAEGMLCGCVPIVTDVGDTVRIVDRYGFVSQDTSSESYAEVLSYAGKLKDSEIESLSSACKKSIADRFGLVEMRNKYLSILGID